MPRALTLIAALLVAVIHSTAAAEQGELDPLDQLQDIRDTFRRGNYEAVVGAAERLLESEPSMLVRAEALQYLGASLGLLDRTAEANDAFEILVKSSARVGHQSERISDRGDQSLRLGAR